jgi:hypothetical protein
MRKPPPGISAILGSVWAWAKTAAKSKQRTLAEKIFEELLKHFMMVS